jgi:hypothetical protein
MPLNESPGELVQLPNPPPTLPLWGKVLWYVAETVAIGVSWKLFDYGQAINGVKAETGAAEATEWRRFVAHWDDTTSVEAADDQYHSIDVVNYTGGQVDSTWNQADHDYVTAAFLNFVVAIAGSTCSRYACKDVKAYRMAYNDYSFVKPFAESGPPVHAASTNTLGAGGSTIAPQICSTISERTPVRANWGRTYLPTLGSSMVDSGGRLTTACVDALANAYSTLANSLHAQDFFLVVPATSSNRSPVRALQNVTEVAVDNVADVHRSRRHKNQTHRLIIPTPAPLEGVQTLPTA